MIKNEDVFTAAHFFYDYHIISIVVGSRSDVENVGKLKKADKHW